MLDIRRPKNHRNGESEAQPKLVAKHGDGVSRVTVVTCVGSRHAVAGLRTDRYLIVVQPTVHFESWRQIHGVRERFPFPIVRTEPNAGAPVAPSQSCESAYLSRTVLVSTSLAKVSEVTEVIRKAGLTTTNIFIPLDEQGSTGVFPWSSRRSGDTQPRREVARRRGPLAAVLRDSHHTSGAVAPFPF